MDEQTESWYTDGWNTGVKAERERIIKLLEGFVKLYGDDGQANILFLIALIKEGKNETS